MPKQKRAVPEDLQSHLTKAGFSSIALIGCRSTGKFYPCCEFDVLADVNDNAIRHEIVGSKFLDVIPIPNKLSEYDLFSFLQMKVDSDPSLLLANLQRSDRQKVAEDYALTKLIESISAIKKAESSHGEKNSVDAAFWINVAAYGLAIASVSAHNLAVHPTHLLDDVRTTFSSIGAPQETFFEAINLQNASRTSVERRLEGINQIMLSSLQLQQGSPESIYVYSKQLSQKVSWLLKNHAVLQAHTLLGYEAVNMLRTIYSKFCIEMGIPEHHNRIITEFLERGERPYRISQDSFRLLGIQSEVSSMETTVQRLRSLTEAVRRAIVGGKMSSLKP